MGGVRLLSSLAGRKMSIVFARRFPAVATFGVILHLPEKREMFCRQVVR
jgi:hypothetical protein